MLERLNHPNDIKALKPEEYSGLAAEIREFLIDKISGTGGHLASNLGVVELTMALHLSFDLPTDKIIWDVGHQSYTHKILSGRKEGFDGLRKYKGLSGFPKRGESEFDAFDTGHSSTSISAGLGMAAARDLQGKDYSVVSVIGDGALTGGMAYEALNNAARLKSNFIIVLNDNEMSISENVGGMSRYLGSIRTGEGYNDLKEGVVHALMAIPGIGETLVDKIKRTKSGIKQLLIPGMLFENMGITYLGPIDGHNFKQLFKVFQEAKKVNHAVLIHVITKKGKGYLPAEKHPCSYHGVEPFEITTGKPKKKKEKPNYTDVFSASIVRLAEKHPNLVGITAAMPEGTGLKRFAKTYPDRFFDVGIAEEHGVTFAAGLALGGMKPVVAVYSTFLQRAYDQILHDVCIQNLPVVFAIDRAGLVGSDGDTHQGIFDLSYLTSIPGMTVLAPKNKYELRRMLEYSVEFDGPIAIRYPRGEAYDGLKAFSAPIEYGKSEFIYQGEEVALIGVGGMVKTCEAVRKRLVDFNYNPSLVNARFVKPIDRELISQLAKNHSLLVVMEENVRSGGYGEHVAAYIHEACPRMRVLNLALPDAFVEHGSVDLLKKDLGLEPEEVTEKIIKILSKNRS